MIILYIILGIIGWIIGSLTATWLFARCMCPIYKKGIDDASGYVFFIIGWPFIIAGVIVLFILYHIGNLWERFNWLNPLLLWDKVARHGSKNPSLEIHK